MMIVIDLKFLATGDDILAECAVQERIWGIGFSMKNGRQFDMSEWQGKNLLEFTLMRVRDVLRILKNRLSGW